MYKTCRMRRSWFIYVTIVGALPLGAQTVFWTESFENGCTSNCLANGSNTGNGAWSVVALSASPGNAIDDPNEWYVSCAENGHTSTVCGSGCTAVSGTATRATLHVSSTSLGDIGAAYDAGGGCGLFYCTNTHKQVISPLISTVGYSTITVGFDYIEFGQTTTDDMYAFQYSTNSGASWTTLSNPAKTSCCGGACNGSRQGQWTHYTGSLPSSCDNISTLCLSFIWKNNDDGLGKDPSFAVDNLTLSYTVILPVELSYFNADAKDGSVLLNWSTATEKDNDHFEVERSADGVLFDAIGEERGAGNSLRSLHYDFIDREPLNGLNYYRLKQVDMNGNYTYSAIVAAQVTKSFDLYSVVFAEQAQQLTLNMQVLEKSNFVFEISDMTGKTIMRAEKQLDVSSHLVKLDGFYVPKGIYILRINGERTTIIRKLFF